MTAEGHTAVLLEENDATRAFLAENLAADGFDLRVTSTPEAALCHLSSLYPDIAIVSVNGGSGRRLLSDIRASADPHLDHRLPVILMGKDRDTLEITRNLNLGADDYIAKPFSYPELLARVNALLRRVALDSKPLTQPLVIGPLRLDTFARTVTLDDAPVHTTRVTFDLLHALAKQPDRVLTKAELLRAVWGVSHNTTSRTLDSHICRLRAALGPAYLKNVWGVGYTLLAA